MELQLVFSLASGWELQEILFKCPLAKAKVSRRGKSLMFNDDDGCFQWTRAVKAFCLLIIGSKLSQIREQPPFLLSGHGNSSAASLDFAISKPTQWISDIFCNGTEGADVRRRVFKVTNSEQKLAGPVVIQLTQSLFETKALLLTNENGEELHEDVLEQMFVNLCAVFSGDIKAEKLLAPQDSSNTSLIRESHGWNTRISFLERQAKSTKKSLSEVALMEPLGVLMAKERIEQFMPPGTDFGAITKQLRQRIPSEESRYLKKKVSFKDPQVLRVGIPSMAIGALILFDSVAKRYQLPVEIYSHHGSSTAVLSTFDDGQLDCAVLSWNAVNKLQSIPIDTSYSGLMLLPRTSVDFVEPLSRNLETKMPMMFSMDTYGYPNQILKVIENKIPELVENCTYMDSSLVEIVNHLSEQHGCGLICEPFSILLTLFFQYEINQQVAGLAHLCDNVLIDLGVKDFGDEYFENLLRALRSEWILLLEDSALLSKKVAELFSDTQYIKTLNQVGGLYRLDDL